MNNAQLLGALARDPELRYTPNGTPCYDATIAGERHVTKVDGSPLSIPWYHNVQIWGKRAESLSQRDYKAGQVFLVSGMLDESSWESETGKQSKVRLKVLDDFREVAGEHELVQDAGGSVRLAGGLNEVRISGNLGYTPELRYTQAGDAVSEITVAVREVFFIQGQQQEKTHWLRVTLWRELAQQAASLQKGDGVFITGSLIGDSYEDKNGNKQHVQKIEASAFYPLVRLGTGASQNQPAQNQVSQNAATPTATPTPTAQMAARKPAAAPASSTAKATTAPKSASKPAPSPAPDALDIDAGLDDFPFPTDDESLPF